MERMDKVYTVEILRDIFMEPVGFFEDKKKAIKFAKNLSMINHRTKDSYYWTVKEWSCLEKETNAKD